MTEEQVSWNLSGQIIQQIGFLLQNSSNYFTNGNFYQSFISGTEIVLFLEPHLSDEEKKEIMELETSFNRLENKFRNIARRKDEEEDEFLYTQKENKKESLSLIKNQRFNTLARYRKLILNLLDKYGFSVSRKKDNTKIS
jgi:hypothetical protein